MHSNSLTKISTPFEDEAEIRLGYSIFLFSLFANSQKIPLSRWLHSKLISTLKFLRNWKTMFWVISQEQHSIKTLEFTETNSYFHSFTYEKNIFSSLSYQWVFFFVNLLADRKAVDSTPRYSLLAGDKNQASIFSPCLRYKWANSIDWSTISYQAEPSLENFRFLHLLSLEKVESLVESNIQNPSFQSLCKLREIMYSRTPTLRNVGET